MNDREKYELEKDQKIRRVQQKYRHLEAKKKNELNVYYLCSSKELWGLDSFFQELKQDRRFHFFAIIYPDPDSTADKAEQSYLDNKRFCKDKGIELIDGYIKHHQVDLNELAEGVMFIDQPGVLSKLEPYNNIEYLSDKFLVSYVPYGYKIVDAGFFHYGLFFHNICWRIFCESEWHYSQFKKYGKLGGDNVIISGLPKLDIFREKSMDYSLWKHGDKALKRIIYAPHWTVNNPPFKSSVIYSTFEFNGDVILKMAEAAPEYDWIFKPHQRLKYWAVESGLMSEDEIVRYYGQWQKLNNALVLDDGNYLETFKTSDVLLTDCGSFLAEYLPTCKPVIHLYNSKSKYNEYGQEIVDAYYRVENNEQLQDIFSKVVVNGEDPLRPKRMKQIKKVMPLEINAGYIMKKELEKLLY